MCEKLPAEFAAALREAAPVWAASKARVITQADVARMAHRDERVHQLTGRRMPKYSASVGPFPFAKGVLFKPTVVEIVHFGVNETYQWGDGRKTSGKEQHSGFKQDYYVDENGQHIQCCLSGSINGNLMRAAGADQRLQVDLGGVGFSRGGGAVKRGTKEAMDVATELTDLLLEFGASVFEIHSREATYAMVDALKSNSAGYKDVVFNLPNGWSVRANVFLDVVRHDKQGVQVAETVPIVVALATDHVLHVRQKFVGYPLVRSLMTATLLAGEKMTAEMASELYGLVKKGGATTEEGVREHMRYVVEGFSDKERGLYNRFLGETDGDIMLAYNKMLSSKGGE